MVFWRNLLLMDKQIRKKRAMTHEKASKVKTGGHLDEELFASLIDGVVVKGTNKKDVVDSSNNLHSVKSGNNKWQIFLYSKSRFEKSIGFFGAQKFVDLLNSIPETFEEYQSKKSISKQKLGEKMVEIKNFLSGKSDLFIHKNKIIFLHEAIFHGNEVNYFTIKVGDKFYIFDSVEVLNAIDKNTIIDNSKAKTKDQDDNQKVLFKDVNRNVNVAEIEIRKESKAKYKAVLFNMYKERILNILNSEIEKEKKLNDFIVTRGNATKTFKLKKN
jgi:hypothetical protein